MKDSFILYNSHYPTINLLTLEEKGMLLDAVFQYHIKGDEPEIQSPSVKIAFSFLKQQFDRDMEKYQKIVERNQKNGSKGGRPLSINLKIPENPMESLVLQKNSEKAQKADNDNDNDNDNVNDHSEKETDVSSCSKDFQKFNIWIKEKAPYCSNPKNLTQINEKEFLKLKDKYSGKQIADIIEKLENRKDLRKRYSSLYRTVNNWAQNEK